MDGIPLVSLELPEAMRRKLEPEVQPAFLILLVRTVEAAKTPVEALVAKAVSVS